MHRFLVVGVAALAALALSAPAGAWTWPADGTVLRPFALGSDPYAGGQHRGVDVAGPEGAAIRAPAAGTVTFAGSLPTHGRGVTIQTADGFAVTLVHLGAIAVEKGASVDEGSSIGTMGSSGTPEHAVPSVHLGIRRASDADAYVDPLGLLPPRAAPVPARSPAPTPVPAPASVPAPAAPPTTPPPASPPAAIGPSPSSAPTPPPTSTPTAPGQPAGGTAVPAPASVPSSAGTAATSPDPARGSSASPAQGSSQGPGLMISVTSAPSAPPVVGGPEAGRPTHVASARAAVSGDAGTPIAGRERLPAGKANAVAADTRDIRRAYGRALPAGTDSPARTDSEGGTSSPARVGASTAVENAGRGGVARQRASRRAPILTREAERAIREAGAPLGPLLAALLLGCLVTVAGARSAARKLADSVPAAKEVERERAWASSVDVR